MYLAQVDFTGVLTIAKLNNRLGIYFSIKRQLNR
jgi:hypothetical protein